MVWNEFGSYWEGDADAARWDAEERRMQQEERYWEALERAGKLLTEAAKEFGKNDRSRRFHSLRRRALSLTEEI